MSDVAVIGLGLMGAALAAAFQKNGKSLTVWNRTSSKCDPFVEAGAHAAASVEDALAASDLVVVCLDDYPVTRALLENPAAGGQLSGKALVQLSTGTPMQARLEHEWIQHHGANYLDGAILNGPPAIGTKHGHILVSGDRSAWEQSGSRLDCLGGTVRFEEGDAGTASALDLAWLSTWYGSFVSIAHACRICAAENIDVERFMQLLPDDIRVQYLARTVRDEAFEKRSATLSVWKKALVSIQAQADEARINGEFPDFVAGLLKRAERAGHGDDNVMALVKVMT